MDDRTAWFLAGLCWLTAAALMLYMCWPLFFEAQASTITAPLVEFCNLYNTAATKALYIGWAECYLT